MEQGLSHGQESLFGCQEKSNVPNAKVKGKLKRGEILDMLFEPRGMWHDFLDALAGRRRTEPAQKKKES